MKRILTSILLLSLLFSCVPIQSLFLGRPDKKDAARFKSTVTSSNNNCFEFELSQKPIGLMVNDWTSDLPDFGGLESLCMNHKVRELLVIQNDSLIYMYRKSGLADQPSHSSYSISKSVVSCLIGIAIDEGYLEDEKTLVSKYLPELAQSSSADSLQIVHLLNHTSGIENSLQMDARLYYGRDILKVIPSIRFNNHPGAKQSYLNINTQLLGVILARATGKSISKYAEEKLWAPIQICNDVKWSTDRLGVEKAFCCISASSLDYAKFGRLYLNKGTWGDKRIFSESWYEKSISRDTLNGSSFNFNYSWHIGLEAYGDFMAIGLYKQHIYIHPKKKLIIVALNDKENKLSAERVNWWYVFRQISDEL